LQHAARDDAGIVDVFTDLDTGHERDRFGKRIRTVRIAFVDFIQPCASLDALQISAKVSPSPKNFTSATFLRVPSASEL
jgi:hypothetical protein